MHRSALAVAAVAALVVTGSSLGTLSAAAAPPQLCGARTNNNTALLQECVTLEGVRQHQAAFQEIADDNNGTRASGTPGYDASAAYVAAKLSSAGWQVPPERS